MEENNSKKSKLIKLVRAKPILWDQTSDQYYRVKQSTKRTVWQEIADEMNMTEKEVKSMWKSLRDYYRLEIKKMPILLSGFAAPTKEEYLQVGTWPFFNEMRFLFDTVVNCKTSGNMDITKNNDNSQENIAIVKKLIVDGYGDYDNNNCNEERNDVSAMEDIDQEFEHDTMITNLPINDTTNQKDTKWKLSVSEQSLDLERRRIELLERKFAMKEKEETKKEEDNIDTFLKYVGSLLRQVKNQRKIQREIINLIQDQLEEEEKI